MTLGQKMRVVFALVVVLLCLSACAPDGQSGATHGDLEGLSNHLEQVVRETCQ